MMTILSFNMLFYKLSFVQCCSSLRCISFTYSWLVWRAGDTSVFRKTTILVQTCKKTQTVLIKAELSFTLLFSSTTGLLLILLILL